MIIYVLIKGNLIESKKVKVICPACTKRKPDNKDIIFFYITIKKKLTIKCNFTLLTFLRIRTQVEPPDKLTKHTKGIRSP